VKKQGNIFLLLALVVFLSSCLSQKKYPQGKYFLKGNDIDQRGFHFNKDDLKDVLRQKPNRKILGLFRLHLGMYNLGSSGDTTVEGHKGLGKFWKKSIKREFLRNNGEEPVYMDSALTAKSREQLTIYLQKKGYFNAVVTDSVAFKRKKVRVIYKLFPGEPYKVRNIYYSTKDEGIDSILTRLKSTSLIIPGQNTEEEILDQERERITSEVRDHGYYFFNKNYITYERDSALNNHQVDVYLYLNRQYENLDPSMNIAHPVENHHPYRYNKISLYTNYNTVEPDKSVRRDTVYFRGVYFVNDTNRHYIRTNPLAHSVFLQPGDLFLQRNVDHTYSRLNDLRLFKLINFKFSEEPRTETQQEYLLNANMLLSPLRKQEYKLEGELTHNGGNLGVAGNFSLQNKNLLKGAETFQFKLSGGLESLRNFADSLETKRLLFFNTYDIGPEVNVGVKRFLFPFITKKQDSSYYSPNTFFTAGFNYQERPDYIRSIAKISYHYEKRLNPDISPYIRFKWYLFEVNSVKVRLDEGFYQKLLDINDVNLLYSYKDHLITSGHLSLIFNNQTSSLLKDFWYATFNFETAGNSLWAARNLFGRNIYAVDSTDKNYVFGLKFAQYVKPDLDISFHKKLNIDNTLVIRTAAGIGITYSNSKDELMPFDKAFFAGGANDIRAWQARTLGPGAYEDSLNIENGGDIKLIANFEYRSMIFRTLEGAVFVDAGNVWIRNDRSGQLPGAEFDSKNMLKQTAIGAGVGLRFNFTFFILRTDFAVKLRDPALPENSRSVYSNKKFVIGDIVPSLAIGYPF
jgi:outer membrane protein assembly factor BamA